MWICRVNSSAFKFIIFSTIPKFAELLKNIYLLWYCSIMNVDVNYILERIEIIPNMILFRKTNHDSFFFSTKYLKATNLRVSKLYYRNQFEF